MNKQSTGKLHSSLLLHTRAAQWNRPTLVLCRLFNISFKWNLIRLLHQKSETGQFQCSLHQSRPFLFSAWDEGEIREGWKSTSQFKSSVRCCYQILTNWKSSTTSWKIIQRQISQNSFQAFPHFKCIQMEEQCEAA